MREQDAYDLAKGSGAVGVHVAPPNEIPHDEAQRSQSETQTSASALRSAPLRENLHAQAVAYRGAANSAIVFNRPPDPNCRVVIVESAW
jgi:hypothetical protein